MIEAFAVFGLVAMLYNFLAFLIRRVEKQQNVEDVRNVSEPVHSFLNEYTNNPKRFKNTFSDYSERSSIMYK